MTPSGNPVEFVRQTARSPLRYPGGKSRAVRTIMSHIPSGTESIVSPFLGGGSVELACAAAGMTVHAADAFEPLVNFWIHAKASPATLSDRVESYHPLDREEFYRLRREFGSVTDPMERAAVFFVLNRASFSGTTLSGGGMSLGHPRFNSGAIGRLRDFRADNLSVECADFRTSIGEHPDTVLYLDPPYATGENLYGNAGGDMHRNFDHAALSDILHRRDGWIMSYNDCGMIRDMYRRYTMLTPAWQYGMSSDKKSRELLILSI